MFNLESLKLFLVISIAISSITCTIIQKTKALFKSSKTIIYYSFVINIIYVGKNPVSYHVFVVFVLQLCASLAIKQGSFFFLVPSFF